jgi:hypothetical protein
MTYKIPLRLTILQLAQRFLIDAVTFMITISFRGPGARSSQAISIYLKACLRSTCVLIITSRSFDYTSS